MQQTIHKSKQMQHTLHLAYIAAGAALIAVCSWLSIPTTVPFTMQTFAIFFILMLLGGKCGTASVLVYLLLGAAGIPVFAEFSSGIGVFLGLTGGYLLGFLLTGLIYWLGERLFGKKLYVQIALLVIGLAACYAFGTAWFLSVYTKQHGSISVQAALSACVYPYVIPDLFKLALAAGLACRIRPMLK